MPNIKLEQDVESVVDLKIRKRVARKVIRDIHDHVAEIDRQEQVEKKLAALLVPQLFLFSALIVSLYLYWTDIMRFLSGFLNF